MSAILDCALELAQQKVRLFPVRPNSKLPAWTDFSSKATCNFAELNEIFGGNDCNSGIACGRQTDGLFLVGFDIDNKDGRNGYETLELMAELGEDLPPTWSQSTPSGGEHRLFWSPIPIRQGTNVCGAGIDFRGDGGYLVGPGSIINGVPYVVLNHLPIAKFPEWAITKYKRQEGATVHTLHGTGRGLPAENQVLALKRSVEFLSGLDVVREGARSNECFKVAARLKDFGLEEGQAVEVMLQYWQCVPPLSTEELSFTVNNAYRYSKNPMGVAATENLFTPIIVPEEPTPVLPKNPVDDLNETFFYYAADGISRVCQETERQGKFHLERFPVFQFHEKYQFRTTLHNGKHTPVTKLWMESPHRRTYDYMRFDPSGELETRAYNTWRGFNVKPAEIPTPRAQEAVDMFLEHCEKNICQGDVNLFNWLINFMAHIFQRPGEKPEVCLVFKGAKGTGKTIISEILDHLIGDNSVIISDKTHALGHFNSIMEDKLLVTLDEAFWSGDRSVEGILKDLITGSTRVITHKGAEPYKTRVYDRIIIIGNEEWLVPATSDERRFAVFNIGEGRQQDRTFFGAMKTGLFKHSGAELLMSYFLNYPLVEDNVNVAPETEALNEQKDHSLNVFQMWWLNCLQEGQVLGSGINGWPDAIPVQDLQQAFTDQMQKERYRGYLPSKISMGMVLKRMAPACGHSRNTTGNVRKYHFPPLDLARQEWDTYRRFKTKWQ